jgi:hypothetical protein
MKNVLKGVLILAGLALFFSLAPIPVLQTSAGAETFTNPSPKFTIEVPKWKKDKSLNPASVLRLVTGPDGTPNVDVAVADLTEGTTFKDFPKSLIAYLGDNYQSSREKVLYEKEITLSDGTPAYEFEVQWDHPAIMIFTYQLVVLKDKKAITVAVSSFAKVSNDLKKIPLSLSFK